jgi:antitoxin component YwqK of YwqJK toxin-antitoxin module
MKTLKRSITVLVCLILFTSCTKSIDGKKERSYIEVREGITYYKGTPFTGEIFEKDENGKLKYKINIKDGKRDGLSEVYYENGQLLVKENFKDGNKNGLYESYYKNGQSKYKLNYKDGKREDGSSESYDKDGKRID